MTTNDNNGLARRSADNDLAATQDSRHALQPRSMKEAYELAKAVAGTPFAPNMNPQGAFASIVSGSELGLTAMQSLRAYAIVKGKPTLWADAMVAVVLASGLCESWETIETSADRCEIVTRRKGSKRDQRCVWTRADAERAKLLGSDTWKMYPAQMLRHRTASDLARAVYPDVLLGVYSHEEMRDSAPLRSDPIDEPPQFTAPSDDPAPLQLPRDNGPAPSGAPLPTAAEPVRPLTVAEHKAMMGMIADAATPAALKSSLKEIADDVARGTDEQRASLRAAAEARYAALAPKPAEEPPPDDEPPTTPRGPRRARKGDAPADATGSVADAANDAQGAAAAWEPFRTSDGVAVESEAQAREILRGYPLPRLARSSRLHTPAWRALCDAEAVKRAAMSATRAA